MPDISIGAESIRYAFDYVLYKYISRRMDHLLITIYSRYPIHPVKAFYYENSQNMSLITDVRINNQYIRVINNHFETISVNSYRGIITASGKDLKIRMKAIKDLILKGKVIIKNQQIKLTRFVLRSSNHLIRYWFVETLIIRQLLIYISSDSKRFGRWFL